ncbi:MAG: heavy metal response regulator transcription factor IrlR [Armatimonadaceae bacterium]
MRILLIEDEPELADAIRQGLEKARYHVDWEANGADGFQRTLEETYALVVLDLMLPGMDGWTICQRMRVRGDSTPILMLTARDDVDDRVRGLEMGADDYLPKPFAFPELRARVAALLRRDRVFKGKVVRIADLEIDTINQQARRNGREIVLTPREYQLLEALATNEGKILSREWIQERVWGDAETYSNTVEVHLGAMRRKVDGNNEVKLIHTVHRQGYVLRRPAEDAREEKE